MSGAFANARAAELLRVLEEIVVVANTAKPLTTALEVIGDKARHAIACTRAVQVADATEPITEEAAATEVIALVASIAPLLARRHPGVQGAALAELLAIWLNGHHPAAMREGLLQMHLRHVRRFVLNDAPAEPVRH